MNDSKKECIRYEYYINLSYPEKKKFTGIAYTKLIVFYIKNGEYHREDGPALISFENKKGYYLFDKFLEKESHKFYNDLMKLKGII